MVSEKTIDKQLERIGFNRHGWGRSEINELHNIILPDEEIFECVNGIYEGGFAMAVSTDVRVLLIDKKPLNFLIVEDLRFDMINEIDYHHRLLGAYISITTGSRTLKFRSYNQQRLRKLISHVQHCMAEVKKKQTYHQEDQNLHLEKINQQLQAYLLAQHEHQKQLHQHLKIGQPEAAAALPPQLEQPIRPSPELSDYLFAQSLLAQYQSQNGDSNPPVEVPGVEQLQAAREALSPVPPEDTGAAQAAQPAEPAPSSQPVPVAAPAQAQTAQANPPTPSTDELYQEGMREVFGKRQAGQSPASQSGTQSNDGKSEEINPLRVAYSKLPMVLRNRKFRSPSSGPRPSFRVSPDSANPV